MITIRIFEEPAEGREPDMLGEIQSEWFLAVGDTIVLEGDKFAAVTEARRTFQRADVDLVPSRVHQGCPDHP
jgi:hypothetical protein